MQAQTFAILSAVLIFILVIELIRRKKMAFKYSLFWLSACLVVLVLTFNNWLIGRLAEFAGFALPSNFLFFLLLVFFIVLSLLLTLYINEQNSRTETLAQALAAMEYKMRELRDDIAEHSRKNTPAK